MTVTTNVTTAITRPPICTRGSISLPNIFRSVTTRPPDLFVTDSVYREETAADSSSARFDNCSGVLSDSRSGDLRRMFESAGS
jgi:hypothetical protein